MDKNEMLLLHVSQSYEADAAIAALKDAEIPAYQKPVPNTGLLSIPGNYGLSENGYDIYISPQDAAKASEVLTGLGYEIEISADSDTVCAEEQDISDREEEATDSSEETPVSPFKEALAKVILMVIALLLITGVVWLVDYIMIWVKSLFA